MGSRIQVAVALKPAQMLSYACLLCFLFALLKFLSLFCVTVCFLKDKENFLSLPLRI